MPPTNCYHYTMNPFGLLFTVFKSNKPLQILLHQWEGNKVFKNYSRNCLAVVDRVDGTLVHVASLSSVFKFITMGREKELVG